MSECSLQMTAEEYEAIKQCEAVVIREYERDGGERFATPVAWGDLDEMEEQAQITGLFIVPVGLHIVGQVCVPVSELLGPAE